MVLDAVQTKLIAPLTTINSKFDDYYKAYTGFEKCIETKGANVVGMTAPATSSTVYTGRTQSTGGTEVFSYDSSTKHYTSTECSTDANALNTAYDALNSELTSATGALTTTTNPTVDSMKDDKTYAQFTDHYQSMQKTRSGLDVKLAQLYQIQNSLPSMSDRSVDSVILASILWIVLASALVYYIFIGNLFNFSQSVPATDTSAIRSGGFASFLPSWFAKKSEP